MSEMITRAPYKIPAGYSIQANRSGFGLPESGTNPLFTEIEISTVIKASHEPAPIPQPIKPILDEKRKIFNSMRGISRFNHSSYFLNSKFYNRQVQYENSKIFYKQAVFMKDFEDDYAETVPFSCYFPYYQLMSYEQLRTYFTWRTKVRNGNIESASISYAFVYIYELLNNIGVKDPADGLDKLMFFWTGFKGFDKTIDKYLRKWVKDYHIYYGLPESFKEFIFENELQDFYPDIAGYQPQTNCSFERMCGISKYNITQSIFYSEQTDRLIAECFDFVIGRIKNVFAGAGIVFEDLIFYPSDSNSIWKPFGGALFYPIAKQPDRRVVLSDNEVYDCSQNKWLLSAVIPTNSGRQLIGYILKQIEAFLRKAIKFKYKLSANLNMVDGQMLEKLDKAGISLEKAVTGAVSEFYKEKNKIVVSVNQTAINRIRSEALDTQEKLVVPEDDLPLVLDFSLKVTSDKDGEQYQSADKQALSDGWTGLKNVLNDFEINALKAVLQGERNMKRFADKNGIMLEVLADCINEKSFDHIGDNILELDENMMLYDEYRQNVMIMVE